MWPKKTDLCKPKMLKTDRLLVGGGIAGYGGGTVSAGKDVIIVGGGQIGCETAIMAIKNMIMS